MAVRTRRGLALCAGIGGIELGLKLADPGYQTVCYVEGEAYAAAVLVLRAQEEALDEAPVWSNIKSFDGVPWRGRVDIVTAGFPCQPWSSAGKQKGRDDERWLWPDIARIVGEVEPTEVLLENVPGLCRGGLEVVLEDLAEMGYDAAWGRFSARGVGAPHLRQRIFVLARLADTRHCSRSTQQERQCKEVGESQVVGEVGGESEGVLADTNGEPSCKERARKGRRVTVEGSSGEGVANPGASGRREGEQDIRGREQDASGGGNLGDSPGEGLEGRTREEHQHEELGEGHQELDDPDQSGLEGRDIGWNGGGHIPTWPPSPEDKRGWERLLTREPSLEPAIRGASDGPSPHVDRLRACGNAVVPVVAATAYRHLGEVLDGR